MNIEDMTPGAFMFIFLGGVILVCYTILFIGHFQNEEFVIYKTECRNETIREYFNFPNDLIPTSCPDSVLNIPCYDNNNNEITNLSCKRWGLCYTLLERPNVLIVERDGPWNSYQYELYFFNKVYNEYEPGETEIFKQDITKEFCEDVEYRGIALNIISEDNGYKENCGYRSDKEYVCLEVISKEDLTTKWLNENCPLRRCTSEGECDLWYCGEYTVEVIE